jgi:hypothetical protein
MGHDNRAEALVETGATTMKRGTKSSKKSVDWARYYDSRDILDEIIEEPFAFSLDEELKREIISGRRGRRLMNVSIKLDPAQVQALRKIATMKSIPYQTLIRAFLADSIRRELKLTGS